MSTSTMVAIKLPILWLELTGQVNRINFMPRMNLLTLDISYCPSQYFLINSSAASSFNFFASLLSSQAAAICIISVRIIWKNFQ